MRPIEYKNKPFLALNAKVGFKNVWLNPVACEEILHNIDVVQRFLAENPPAQPPVGMDTAEYRAFKAWQAQQAKRTYPVKAFTPTPPKPANDVAAELEAEAARLEAK